MKTCIDNKEPLFYNEYEQFYKMTGRRHNQKTYDLLKKKRETAIRYQSDLEAEGNKDWFDLLMIQTDCVTEPYELFAGKMARYIYTVCNSRG